MGVEIIGVMIPIIAIIGGIIMVIYLRRFENSERMAMIEKGVDASIFARKERNISGALRASLLFIGVGVGILLGYFLDRAYDMDEIAYFAMLFIFGGVGLGLAYLIEEKKEKEKKLEEGRKLHE